MSFQLLSILVFVHVRNSTRVSRFYTGNQNIFCVLRSFNFVQPNLRVQDDSLLFLSFPLFLDSRGKLESFEYVELI